LWVPLCIPVLVAVAFVGDVFIVALLAFAITPPGALLAIPLILGLGLYGIAGTEDDAPHPDGGVRLAGTLRSFDLPEGHP
jgi:hypothetical protein